MADSPSVAVPTTTKPSVSSTSCAIARKDGWSSTINTVTGARDAIGPIVSPIGA